MLHLKTLFLGQLDEAKWGKEILNISPVTTKELFHAFKILGNHKK